MVLVASGVSSVGKQVLTGVTPIASRGYTLYFPGLDFAFYGLLGGISMAQINTPVSGVFRSEQFEPVWNYSTRYEPIRVGSRVFVLWFKAGGLDWQFWD